MSEFLPGTVPIVCAGFQTYCDDELKKNPSSIELIEGVS